MAGFKRHLTVRRRGRRVAACGNPDARYLTVHPPLVTCGGCKRTLAMADAELAQSHVNNKRKTRKVRR